MLEIAAGLQLKPAGSLYAKYVSTKHFKDVPMLKRDEDGEGGGGGGEYQEVARSGTARSTCAWNAYYVFCARFCS